MMIRAGAARRGKSAVLWSDAHACPTDTHEDTLRFEALGWLIDQLNPDAAICLGDGGEFRSLNGYRGGTIMGGDGSDEGHDLIADIDAFKTSMRIIRRAQRDHDGRHRNARRLDRLSRTEWHFIMGNHEDFLDRLGQRYPAMKRVISTRTLINFLEDEEDWITHRFLHPLKWEGVSFSHYWPSQKARQGLPIDRILARNCCSSISGNQHIFQIRSTRRPDGSRANAIVLPSFKPLRRLARYEDSGLLLLKNVNDGDFSHEFIRLQDIIDEWRASTRKKSRRAYLNIGPRPIDSSIKRASTL